jgi:hypothetical protein
MPEETNVEQVRARFGATAERVAEHSGEQVEMVREQLRSFVAPRGDERALDVAPAPGRSRSRWRRSCARSSASTSSRSCSNGRVRAPGERHVRRRRRDEPAVRAGSFDLVCTRRTLHHIARRSSSSPS